MIRPPPRPTLFPYTTLSRSVQVPARFRVVIHAEPGAGHLFAGAVGLAEIPRQVVLRNPVTAAAEQDYLSRDFSEPYRARDRKSTRLNSSHSQISYAVFCLQK